MIISHKHRFIFIKNRKVAGTSIEKALHDICGPDDVLTPDHLHSGEHDELLATSRNYRGRFNPLPELLAAGSALDMARVMRDFAVRPRFYNHMRATSVKHRIPRRIWNSYYKFCFERNPWDKTISFYFWRHRAIPPSMDLNAYILDTSHSETLDQRFPSDWKRYSNNNKLIVDNIFDYENIEFNLTEALQKAGLKSHYISSISLPRIKSDVRNPEAAVTLSREASDRIAEVFSKEIGAFGYRPPEGLLSP
jgi:hypothetical protein